MLKSPRNVLFIFAAFLATVGAAATALTGFDGIGSVHGLRFAAAMLFFGLLAARAERNRTLAIVGIDLAMLIIAAAGANYARLAWKWWRQGNTSLAEEGLAILLAVACVVVLPVLWRSRPRPETRGGDWWRISPLLILPFSLVGFARRRHGLGLLRRGGFTLGALLLAAGLMMSSASRLPTRTMATMMETAKVASEHEDTIRRVLADPETRDAILEHPRVKAVIDEALGDDAGPSTAALRDAVERLGDGEMPALPELLTPETLEAGREILELIADEPAPPTGDTDAGEGLDVSEIIGRLAAKGIDVGSHLDKLHEIDPGDPRVSRVLDELDIDPEAAAAFTRGAPPSAARPNTGPPARRRPARGTEARPAELLELRVGEQVTRSRSVRRIVPRTSPRVAPPRVNTRDAALYDPPRPPSLPPPGAAATRPPSSPAAPPAPAPEPAPEPPPPATIVQADSPVAASPTEDVRKAAPAEAAAPDRPAADGGNVPRWAELGGVLCIVAGLVFVTISLSRRS